MNDLYLLEITELAALIARRAVSPVEIVRAQLDRISRLDGSLRSFVAVTAEAALAAARSAEAEIMRGVHRGPLHGVPVGIKDVFWTRDTPSAGGMPLHRGFRSTRDATAVARLREAGAVILGKLQLTEGAYSDHHPSVTPPVNPWSAEHWTGISSSGPAAALAAGLCYGALASDTGGSIRWPCGATGLTGIKPSWGRVSRDGMWSLAPSIDHVGPMARSAADAALLLAAIAGPDPLDPTAMQVPAPTVPAASDLAGLRVGVDEGWNGDGVDADVRRVLAEAAEVLRALGAALVPVTVPDVEAAVADWPNLCAVEAAVAHAATYPSRKEEYGPVLAAVLEAGRAVTGAAHQGMLLRRAELRGRFDALFAGVDLLLCPVQPFGPLTLRALGTMGERPDLIARLQRHTCPFDMTGGPTITLPGGHDGAGMPIGFQLAAGHRREDLLIRAGMAFQGTTAWHRRHPDV